ncbi:MAG: hypothetical protein LBO79_10215 [Zoogloeaceae bacterium]|nr:hypothetical protein [Zoogloeaceae bacterium]
MIAGSEVSDEWRIASVLLSFLLAWLTYRYVEKKLRFHPRKNMPKLLLAAGSSISLLAAAAYYEKGWPERFEFTRARQIQSSIWNNTPDCTKQFGWKHDYCQYFSSGDSKRWVLFLGDSHAHALAKAFPESENIGLAPNTGLLALGKAGCPGWRWAHLSDRGCPSFEEMSTQATKDRSGQIIILVDRYSMYYEGNGFGVGTARSLLSFRPPNQTPVTGNKAAFVAALRATLDAWRVQGKKVIFVHQVPELGFKPMSKGRPLGTYFSNKSTERTIPRAMVEARQRGYRQAVTEILKDYPEVWVFDPMDDLCDAKHCYAIKDGESLYYDDNHVNYLGSRFLLKRLIPFLQKNHR